MKSSRVAGVLALVGVLALAAVPRDALAAADVHRFNVVLSATPTQVDGGDFNGFIDTINRTALNPFGLEGMKRISFAWMFDAQLHYFLRPNIAVHGGVGQLRAVTNREYLPFLTAAVQLHGEVLSVPVSLGGAYYLAPYNQGDFQARMFFGAGITSLVYNRALFQQVAVNIPGVPNVFLAGTQDSPGYYIETGGHMFFASRFSVILGAMYRNAKIQNLVDRETGQPFLPLDGKPFTLDMSGIGARGGLAIGF